MARDTVVQVRPPSVDLANATWSRAPPVARASCHTMYTSLWPVRGSAAISGMMSPVRTGLPYVGSVTPTDSSLSTIVAAGVHVAPRSVERSVATLYPRTLCAFLKL